MFTTHRITDELYDDNYLLIAIHSDLEGHAMAYAINSVCGLLLKRMDRDHYLDDDRHFASFDWEDQINGAYWCLIANSCEVELAMASGGLFDNDLSKRRDPLIREHREVDFFLKLESGEPGTMAAALAAIKALDRVKTAYPLEPQSLKSKRNLTF